MTIDAQKLREKAQKLIAREKLEEAAQLYKSTLDKEPSDPDLWCELGSLQKSIDDKDGCGLSYFKAAEIYLHSGQDRHALAACKKAVQSGGTGGAVEGARELLKVLATRLKARKERPTASTTGSAGGAGPAGKAGLAGGVGLAGKAGLAGGVGLAGNGGLAGGAGPAGKAGLAGGAGPAQSLLSQVASSGRVQLGEVRHLVASDYHEIDTTPLPPPLSALRPLRRQQISDFVREPTSELDVTDLEEAVSPEASLPGGKPHSGGRPHPSASPPPSPISYWDELHGGPKTQRKARVALASGRVVAPKEHFMVLSRRDTGTLLAGLRSGQSFGIPDLELAQIAREAMGPDERTLRLLGRSMLFEGLSREQLAQHAPRDRVRSFTRGETLASTGSGGDGLLSLLSGNASVQTLDTPPRELAVLRPGAILGEQSFVGTQGMKTCVIAKDEVEAVALSRSQAEELLADHPASLYTMLRVVEERVVDNMLQRAGFFRLFSPDERDQICPRFEILEVADDEVIVEQGTPSKTLCLLMSGVIELSHRGSQRHTAKMLLDPGGVFGEESLIDGRPQIFTARTTARSWIMLLRREDYLQIYERHPALVKSLKDVLRRRRRALEQVTSGEIDLSGARWPDFDPSLFLDQ